MLIRPIRNEEDYLASLHLINSLWDAEKSSYEYDQLEVLTSLIDAYEQTNYPLNFPDPIEALKFHIIHKDISTQDLITIFGSLAEFEAIMDREKPLGLPVIWKLCQEWQIPAECLIRPYKIKR